MIFSMVIGSEFIAYALEKYNIGEVFLLKKQPEDISMLDIINIFELTTKLNLCLEEDRYCSRFATQSLL